MDHDRFDREARERAASMSIDIGTAFAQGYTSICFTMWEALLADMFRFNPWLAAYYIQKK